MKELKLTITHFKMLDTVLYFNKKELYPLAEGVYKIVAGIVDEETVEYMNCPTFATLVSFSSKKVCRYLLMLQRYGFLRKVFDRETNELYLSITPQGKDAVEMYHRKHRLQYVKKKREVKKTIVKIEN
ncbi:MAG: hypothetical protein K6F07_01740 [Bacilli bacterium]|nr:hypothetical protein [Bacilli bacterium]